MRTIRRRRRVRRLVLGLALVVTLLFGAVVLLTNSPLTKSLVIPRIESALGVSVSARRAFVTAGGTLVLDDARLKIRGVSGPAAEFLSVRRLEVDIDWRAGGAIRAARIIEPALLLSQSLDDSSLNIAALRLPSGGGSGPIPSISLARATITIGEHRRDQFTPLRSVRVDGKLVPDPAAPGAYRFDLRQTSADARERRAGFLLSGRLEQGGIDLTIENFDLNAWRAESAPSPIRPIVQQIDVRGSVPRATFKWSPAEGVRAGMELADVSLNLPIEPESWDVLAAGVMGPPTPYMRMHGVSGRIEFALDRVSATLDGRLEDLPYHVDLQYNGVELDSPFEANFRSNDFRVEASPRLWPIAPPEARQWLDKFSRPTAIISTRMRIWREAAPAGATEEAPIRAAGTMTIRDGSAAYESFPYRFENMAGTVEFTDTSIVIKELTGRAPSGATMRATARIAPLDASAGIEVVVTASGVPIDPSLEAAFPGGRGAIVTALFNREQYDAMLRDGIVRSAAGAAAERVELDSLVSKPNPDQARLDQLRARAAIPVFDLGGRADIDVAVRSKIGENEPVAITVDVRLDHAGLVPERFPVPVRASNLVAHVDNGPGRLLSGRFEGIHGGSAAVDASFNIPFTSDGPQEMNPDITIDLVDIPFDEPMIRALPGKGDAGNTVRRILRELRVGGAARGTVRIQPRTSDADLGFDAGVTFDNASINPAGAIAVNGLAGTLNATENKVSLQLSAPTAAAAGAPACGPVRVELLAELPNEGDTTLTASVFSTALDLGAPWADLAGVFSTKARERLQSLGERYKPAGFADTAVHVTSIGSAPSEVSVEVSNLSNVSAEALGARALMAAPDGRATVFTGAGPTRVALDDLRGELTYADEPGGYVRADGSITLSPSPATGAPQPAAAVGGSEPALTVTLTGGRLESSLVRALVAEAGTINESYRRMRPNGTFDAGATILARADGPGVGNLWIEPKRLAIDLDGTPLGFELESGRVEVSGDSGVARGVRARGGPRAGAATGGGSWSLAGDVSWTALGDGGRDTSIRATGSAEFGVGGGGGLSEEVRAALPKGVREALDQYKVRVDGPIRAEELVVGARLSDDPARRSVSVDGRLTFENLSADAGVVISEATGTVEGRVESGQGGGAGVIRLDVALAGARVEGVRATDVAAEVRTGDDGAVTGSGSATVYGGRVTMDGMLEPRAVNAAGGLPTGGSTASGPASGGAGRWYEATIRAAGVRVKPLVDEVRGDEGDVSERANRTVAAEVEEATSRGVLDAEVTLRGRAGEAATRSGRGSVQVSEGRVVNFPSLVRLIEVSNWQLPVNAPLDFARATFYVEGRRVWFDAIHLLSQRVQVNGVGSLTMPGRELDLLFTTRPAYGVPVLTALYSAVRDELMTTRMTGTVNKPEFRLVQWSAARRMLGGALGQAPDARQRQESEFRQQPERQVIRPRREGLEAREPDSR
ncbi:MAG: hypothetical protein ACKVW3_13970 [Phycisphaerales bacterium]